MNKSRLSVLDKYADGIEVMPLSKEYWQKDAALQADLERENDKARELLRVSEMKMHERFTI